MNRPVPGRYAGRVVPVTNGTSVWKGSDDATYMNGSVHVVDGGYTSG